MTSPHHSIRQTWLDQTQEPILGAGQPILDAHHHLWDRPSSRYMNKAFMADVQSGHDVRASIFVQCRTGYRETGPIQLQPLGEVETILRWSLENPNFPAGLIGMADLQLGSAVVPVLKGMLEIAQGKLCGIRNTIAWHADPSVWSNPNPPPDGLLRTSQFLQGANVLVRFGLVLDIWAYQTQLEEVFQIAKAVPDLPIVINHCGGPLGVGSHDRFDRDNVNAWRLGVTRLARLPNTRMKFGGFGLSIMGWNYALETVAPSSDRLVRDWLPYFDTLLSVFGAKRMMFESNFPVDKGQFSYSILWNAFHRLAASLSFDEQQALFWKTAAQTYSINQKIFV